LSWSCFSLLKLSEFSLFLNSPQGCLASRLLFQNGPTGALVDYMRTRGGRRRHGEPPMHDRSTVTSEPLPQLPQTAIDPLRDRSSNNALLHPPRSVVGTLSTNNPIMAPVKRTVKAREKPVTPKTRRTVANETANSSATTNHRGLPEPSTELVVPSASSIPASTIPPQPQKPRDIPKTPLTAPQSSSSSSSSSDSPL
jgi:hypothetical protein